MTAAKKPPAKKKATPATSERVFVPKGSYKHTADRRYLTKKAQAAEATPKMMQITLGQLGVPARKVAETMGVSLSAVRDRMQGKTPWRVDEVAGLAEVYGFKAEDIINPRLTYQQMQTMFGEMMRGFEQLGLIAPAPEQLRLQTTA